MHHIEKKFQSGNKLLSIVRYPHIYPDGSIEHPDLWIESQDDGNQLCFEVESKEQLEAIIEHLLIVKANWDLAENPEFQ